MVKSRAFKRWVLEDSKRPKTETLGVYKCIDVYIYIYKYTYVLNAWLDSVGWDVKVYDKSL